MSNTVKNNYYDTINNGVDNPSVVWTSTIFDYGGYALMSRNYIRGLDKRGWKIGVEAIRGTTEISQEEIDFFNLKRKLVKTFDGEVKGVPYLNPNQVSVIAHLPLWNVPKFKKNVIYSMMESKDTNAGFIERCNKYYDVCWTPTNYNKEDFERNGMKIPITVMPIGVDDIYFDKENIIKDMCFNFKVFNKKKICNQDEIPDQPSGFKFLSVFRWSFRKGYDLLLKTYLETFSNRDDVSLIIFSRHAAMSHDPKFSEAIKNDILSIIEKYGNENHAPIYWCDDRIDQELMPSVYALGDAFISTSRGEGMSLPTLEASQIGLPIIAPFHTAFTDYITEDRAYVIPVDEWVICNDMPEWSGWVTADFFNQKFPRFGDSSKEILSNHMKSIMIKSEENKIKNSNMKKFIYDNYTWEKCLDRAENEIKGYLSE